MIRVKEKAISIINLKYSNFVLLGMVFLTAILYVYFANEAVRSVTTLQEKKSEFQNLVADVTDLESKRFNIEGDIDSDMARSLGLVEAEPIFIVKTDKKDTLSLNSR
jgi:uncharacterized protein YhdP